MDEVTEHGPVEADDTATAETVENQIVGVGFDKVTRADEALLAVVHLQQEGEVAIADAVVVIKDDAGRTHVRQTIDPGPGRMALGAGMWGLLIGSLFGGPLIGAVAAAGGGALAGRLIDVGLDDDWAKEVAGWLDPGTSALLLLVAGEVRPALVTELGRFDGTVLYCTFPEAVRRELEAALASGAEPVPVQAAPPTEPGS